MNVKEKKLSNKKEEVSSKKRSKMTKKRSVPLGISIQDVSKKGPLPTCYSCNNKISRQDRRIVQFISGKFDITRSFHINRDCILSGLNVTDINSFNTLVKEEDKILIEVPTIQINTQKVHTMSGNNTIKNKQETIQQNAKFSLDISEEKDSIPKSNYIDVNSSIEVSRILLDMQKMHTMPVNTTTKDEHKIIQQNASFSSLEQKHSITLTGRLTQL